VIVLRVRTCLYETYYLKIGGEDETIGSFFFPLLYLAILADRMRNRIAPLIIACLESSRERYFATYGGTYCSSRGSFSPNVRALVP
jgi:hypothetical protein